MRKGFANSTSSRWNADASELISSWPSKFSKERLTLTHLNSRAHLPITARTKPSSTKERCLLCPDSEILGQTSSSSNLRKLSFFLQKTFGPSLVRNLPCSTCVASVPIQFSQYCYLRLFMFSLNTQSPTRVCGYYWTSCPFLPLIYK